MWKRLHRVSTRRAGASHDYATLGASRKAARDRQDLVAGDGGELQGLAQHELPMLETESPKEE
jgi:hypothetical protein